jgi:hypothetical protein
MAISNDILSNKGQFRVYVVNAPRILLTYQLLKEVYKVFMLRGIESRYMFVHSGGTTNERELEEIRMLSKVEGNNIPYSEILSGTSPNDVREMMYKAKAQNLPLVLFSTYNSAQNIEIAREGFFDPIAITLCDEAQYLVQEQFHDILNVLTSNRCYFFTATTIHTPSDMGRGMNNKEAYGDVLYSMSPREAIDRGFMVRPRMHFVTTAGVYNSDDYNRSLNFIIKDTFVQHEKALEHLKPKLLISVKGTQDIKGFIGSNEYRELVSQGIVIYAIASNDEIGCNINGEKVRRQDFLKRLKVDGEDRSKRIIVLHYDILTEGIDISGFTGIMPLRTLSKSKFLQTYGRVARLDFEDREDFKNKKLSPKDVSKMRKPYAYIIIPNITNNNEDDKENFIELIRELRTYGFKPYEDIISSEIKHGIPEIEQLTGLNEVRTRIPLRGELIQELEMQIENEEDARLSKKDFLSKIIDKF